MDRNRVTVLLTRPEPGSRAFARRLRDVLGGDIVVIQSPLLGISFGETPPDLDGARGLIFTSANGVRAMTQHGLLPDLPAFAVGPATADAIARSGGQARAVYSDASSLVEGVIAARPDAPLVHIRGRHAQGDVAATLSAAGLPTRDHVAYDQPLLDLTGPAREVLNGGDPVVAPLFSARTARHFLAQGPFAAPLFLAAISPAVAALAEGSGAAQVVTADTPDADGMLAATARLFEAASLLEPRCRGN